MFTYRSHDHAISPFCHSEVPKDEFDQAHFERNLLGTARRAFVRHSAGNFGRTFDNRQTLAGNGETRRSSRRHHHARSGAWRCQKRDDVLQTNELEHSGHGAKYGGISLPMLRSDNRSVWGLGRECGALSFIFIDNTVNTCISLKLLYILRATLFPHQGHANGGECPWQG